MTAVSTGKARVAGKAVGCLAVAGLTLMALHLWAGVGGNTLGRVALPALGELLAIMAAALCVARAALVKRDRLAWTALAGAVTCWVIGDVYRQLAFGSTQSRPFPSLADAFYLALYPLAYVGLILLVRGRSLRFQPSMWLDGVIGASTAAAVGSAGLGQIAHRGGGASAAVAVNLAYPLGDLVLLALLAGVFALTGWRPGRSWLAIGVGFGMFTAADLTFLVYAAHGQENVLWLGALWIISLLVISAGAWLRDPSEPVIRIDGWRMLAVPLVLAAVAIAILVIAQVVHLALLSVVLAAAALALVMVRMALTFRENISLLETRDQAITDELTGLGNRRLLMQRLGRSDDGAGLLLLDLDRFKELNDALGHEVGDRLLAMIGQRMRAALPEADVLARLGGDEFAVLLRQIDDERLEQAATTLLAVLNDPFDLAGLRLHVGASVGGALSAPDSREPAALLRDADVAMYEAKRAGGGFARYTPAGDMHSRERLALAQDLRDAIGAGELVLHYQPQLELPAGRPACVEALVRWRHPRLGLLFPDRFLPLAEEAGLMRPLTTWVLREALAQLARWEAETGRRLHVAVNVATANLLDSGLPAETARLLAEAGIEPGRLVIEVPEKLLMNDIARIAAVMGELHDLGVALSLDDFGAGYTSFAHLRRLPLDEVKIDRSFVMRMTDDPQDAAIVTAALQLARDLGLRTVAEGVESAAAWSMLARMGACALQGFHISRPVPAEQLTEWLAGRAWEALPDPGAIAARERRI